MAKKDFFPRKLAEVIVFLTNWLSKYPTIAAALGIDALEITNNTTVVQAEIDAHANLTTKKAESKAAVEAHLAQLKTTRDEIRRAAGELKKRPDYTEAEGDELMIIGPEEEEIDYENAKPELEGKLVGGLPVIGFPLEVYEGIRLESMRGAEEDYSFLANDTHPPYHDTRPKLDPTKPEERKFVAWYIYGDEIIGQQSDELTVVVP